jgi:hypothetical protein
MTGRDALFSLEQKQRDDLKRNATSNQEKATQAGDVNAEGGDLSLPPDLQLLKLILERLGINLQPLLDRYGPSRVAEIVEKLFGLKLKMGAKSEGHSGQSALRIEMPSSRSQSQSQIQSQRQIQDPAPQATSRPNWGMIYDRQDIYSESEKTSFSAAGIVKTADGKEIEFNVSLNMSREFVQASSFQVRAGAAVDPLMINFNGTAAQLADSRFGFDLNLDGEKEQIANTGSNSAFLALDRNGDGRINNGRELFGPTTGDGFAELAKFDSDGNQWIDEKDAVYSRLRVWQPTSNGGGATVSLKEAGVGAIYLGRQDTQFEMTNAQNDSLGQVATSGVYLQENGAVGTIQQVNLVA